MSTRATDGCCSRRSGLRARVCRTARPAALPRTALSAARWTYSGWFVFVSDSGLPYGETLTAPERPVMFEGPSHSSRSIRRALIHVHPTPGGLMHSPRLVRSHPCLPPANRTLAAPWRRAWLGAALLLVAMVSPSGSALAQNTGRITGTITDSASGRPVGNVQVSVV